jgi:hypothetical protein
MYRRTKLPLAQRRIMDKAISDGVVIDVRGIDPASLLTQANGSDVLTALDRLLNSQAENYNGFSSFI